MCFEYMSTEVRLFTLTSTYRETESQEFPRTGLDPQVVFYLMVMSPTGNPQLKEKKKPSSKFMQSAL